MKPAAVIAVPIWLRSRSILSHVFTSLTKLPLKVVTPSFRSTNMMEPTSPSASTVAAAASCCTIIWTMHIGSERSSDGRCLSWPAPEVPASPTRTIGLR